MRASSAGALALALASLLFGFTPPQGDGTGGGGGGGSSTAVSAHVEVTTADSIANDTLSIISWDAEVYDTDAIWASGTPTRLTVPSDGKYRLTVVAHWGANNTGSRRVGWYHRDSAGTLVKSYSEDFGVTGTDTSAGAATFAMEHACTAGDYFEVEVYQDSGGALFWGVNSAVMFTKIGD